MTNTITLDKNFFFGGNSTFTVQSEKTGEHKTFKIKQGKPTPQYPNPSFFVSILSGPCNETSYSYIGITNPLNGELRLTKASKRNADSPDVLTFNWLMKHLFTDKVLNNALVHHDGKCGCCGRKLTVPESIKNGIGPECIKKFGM